MSYSSDDTQSPGQTILERELVEDVVRAHKMINRYMSRRQQVALSQSDPDDSADLRKLLNDVDVAVLSAFDGLKPYCQRELAEHWMQTQVDQWRGHPVVFGSWTDRAAAGDDGVLYLDEIRGRVISQTRTEHVRFEGRTEQTIHQPVLLSIEGYDYVKGLLVETLRKSDMAPEVDMPTYNDPAVLTHEEDHE